MCRAHGIAENTFYRWRKVYGSMSIHEAQRLKELEKENGCLKRLLAERVLERDLLKDVLEKGLTVAEKWGVVQGLAAKGVSIKRACALVQLHRSTYHSVAHPADEAEIAQSL